MEFQQLEMFAAVVEEGSVSRAAGRVCRTAPAVSIALRKLEEEMGAPLFDRSERHNYRLTASGKTLYSFATRILEMRKEATAAVREVRRGGRGTLRLGAPGRNSLFLLPSVIPPPHESHPAVANQVECGHTERPARA